MHIYARQGDLVIRKEPIPRGFKLKAVAQPLILAGRESAPHTIKDFSGIEYGESNGVQRMRIPSTVQLSHDGRHQFTTLEAGEYAVESLAEMRGELAAAVED